MLINTITKEQIEEVAFKQLFPETSFPLELTDDHLAPFGHAVKNYSLTTPVVGVYQRLVESEPEMIDGKWWAQFDTVDMTPDEVAVVDKEIMVNIISDAQSLLDNFASERGYDGIISACSYSGSSIDKFASEGCYAVIARDTTWSTLYTLLEQVEAGIKPKPTCFADVLPLLPSLSWPNT